MTDIKISQQYKLLIMNIVEVLLAIKNHDSIKLKIQIEMLIYQKVVSKNSTIYAYIGEQV